MVTRVGVGSDKAAAPMTHMRLVLYLWCTHTMGTYIDASTEYGSCLRSPGAPGGDLSVAPTACQQLVLYLLVASSRRTVDVAPSAAL